MNFIDGLIKDKILPKKTSESMIEDVLQYFVLGFEHIRQSPSLLADTLIFVKYIFF